MNKWEDWLDRFGKAINADPMVLVVVALGLITILAIAFGIVYAIWSVVGFYCAPLVAIPVAILSFIDDLFFKGFRDD